MLGGTYQMVDYLMTLPSFFITTNCLSKSVQNVLYSIAKIISLFVNHIQTDVIKYNYLFDNIVTMKTTQHTLRPHKIADRLPIDVVLKCNSYSVTFWKKNYV